MGIKKEVTRHDLKTWKEYYQQVFMGKKTFEIRINDRDFKEGDYLILREWDNKKESYTGRQMGRKVTSILEGGKFGLHKDYVAMSIQ